MGVGLSLGMMAAGLPLAVIGARAYRSRRKLALVMVSGAGIFLIGAIGLLIALW